MSRGNPDVDFLFPGDVLEVMESFSMRVYFPPAIRPTRFINPEEEDWIEYQGLLRGTKLYHFVFMPRDEDGTVMKQIHFAVKKVDSILRYCTLL